VKVQPAVLLSVFVALQPMLKDLVDNPEGSAMATLWALCLVVAWLIAREALKPPEQ
jgi:hypothetical protein